MLGITTTWTYRDELQETHLGLSLQVYSPAKRKWVHIAYFKPKQIKQAKKAYEKVMKWCAKNPRHLDFSFNNLLEVKRMLLSDDGASMDTGNYVDMLNMLTRVSYILQIRLEVL